MFILYFILAILILDVLLVCYNKCLTYKLTHLNNIRDLEDRVSKLAEDILSRTEKLKKISMEDYTEVLLCSAALLDIMGKVRRYYIFVSKCPFYFTRESEMKIKEKFGRYLPTLNEAEAVLGRLSK